MATRPDQPPSRRALVAAGVVVVGCLTLFGLIAEDVLDGGGLISRDHAGLGWFVEHRTDTLITVARLVSTLGGFVALCAYAIALLLLLRARRMPVPLAVAPLVALLLGGLASLVAKELFGRERPPLTLHATTVGLASFPSGHATDAAAFFIAAASTLALGVTREGWAKVGLLAGAVALAAVVGLSRIVLAVHWLSDVIAGWALGSAVSVSVVMLAWCSATRTASVSARRQADRH